MRYSIRGITAAQVKQAGGQAVTEAKNSGIIFATLSESQVRKLIEQGAIVKKVGGVGTAISPPVVAPPVPIQTPPIYSPQDMTYLLGIEEMRQIVDPPLYGRGFNLAIIDTGIRETHSHLRGRVVYRKNFTVDPHRDGFDHGTGVAAIALTVAPEANILDLKALDDRGSGTEENVVMALEEALALKEAGHEYAPHVINLSLGAPDDGDPDNILRVACRAAIERGIWVFAAAGNAGPYPGTIMSPACERYVLAIGSAKYLPEEKTFAVSDFSSRGDTSEGLVKPDAVLFGENILMASSASDTATVSKSGTSFACPFAAAMAILYHEGVIAYGGVRYPEGPPPGIYPEITHLISVDELLDRYLPGICIKPQGAAKTKDPDYGYGLPFAPMMQRALSPVPPELTSSLISMVSACLMIGMVGRLVQGVYASGERRASR